MAPAKGLEGRDERSDGVPTGGCDRYSDGDGMYVVWRPPFGDRVSFIAKFIAKEVLREYGQEVKSAAAGLAKTPPVEPGPPPLADKIPGATAPGVFHVGQACDYRIVWPFRDGTERARWVTPKKKKGVIPDIVINGIQEIVVKN